MTANTNDGTKSPPALRIGLSGGSIAGLPDHSTAPRGTETEVLAAVRAAGFEAFQGGNTTLCHAAGLIPSAGGRIDAVGEATPLARRLRDQGYDCATLHVAKGIEDEARVYTLVEDILAASEAESFPLYIETHRATITQDIWRTVKIVERFPEVRFNGDFSHWYTGLEMVYGGIEEKWTFMASVFERVRYLHGRIGNPGSMQVAVYGAQDTASYVGHFREMWTRSMVGFLRDAQPGDYLTFAPELLTSTIYYARTLPDAAGNPTEESDRWEQSLVYADIARECFADAQSRVSTGQG